ncbi:MAG: DnaA/Hda family protein, partial [Chloroflexota bacterium]
MDAERAWQSVLGQLQMEMPKASYDTWVRDTRLVDYNEDCLTIGVRNAYARDWLESRLASTVTRMLVGILDRSVEVEFVVQQSGQEVFELVEKPAEAAQAHRPDVVKSHNSTLNPRYTFESYIVGASNRLAHAAALAVAEKPARAYNPLFLYGGVGLGKTHLLHAIGNACHECGLSVLYVSSEEFTNDMINAIRERTTQAFRDKYRSIDVLMVDDIQFIAGKESTQEEFFHTFNTL